MNQTSGYIHGFDPVEQERLLAQARILAPGVFGGLDFAGHSRLLELGCGVGAELLLLAERAPHLHLTGIDRSAEHLAQASQNLAGLIDAGRVHLVSADAAALPFADGEFDAVLTVWMLEHVADPEPILREALRVLRPGGRVILMEVNNATFRFEPPLPAIHAWWEQFNQCQTASGGNPFVGATLAQTLARAGAREVRDTVFPNIDSRQDPHRRAELLDYLEALLRSGTESLERAGLGGDSQALREDFDQARRDPSIQFQYHAHRVTGLR